MNCWHYSDYSDYWALNYSRRHMRVLPGLKIVSSVPGPMIAIESLRSQCRVITTGGDSNAETSDDDADLLGYLEAAIEHAEDFTGLAIALRTYEMSLDAYPFSSLRSIDIPRPPLIAIESFLAVSGGSEGELDPGDDYLLDDYRFPARILPAGLTWPTMTSETNGIKIRFLAGYQNGDYFNTDYEGAQTLPASIRMALLLLVGHFYANRESTVERALSTIPHGFEDLLRPKRVELGMA